jgi:hypothetical protein
VPGQAISGWITGSIFVLSGLDGSIIHYIKGTVGFGGFGSSVSSAGDVNLDGFSDFIVGGPYDLQGGHAFVYSGLTGGVLHQWSGNTSTDQFGYVVAGPGDLNNDGFADLLVSAPGEDIGGLIRAGSVRLFSGANGNLLQEWSGTGNDQMHGFACSGAGDVDADGINDIVVGNWAGTESASVYSGATGNLIYYFESTDGPEGFGTSVSGAGDVNGDGYSDVLIGETSSNFGNLDAGSAYVYSGADGSLFHRWDGGSSKGYLGFGVSDAGDVNGDGYDDIFVGTQFSDSGSIDNTGLAEVYSFHPILTSNATSISAATGGTIHFDVDLPSSASSHAYKVLISESGIGPTNYGVDIPLTQDALVIDTFLGGYPVPATNMHGTLDAIGNATASLTIPAGIPSSLIGNVYYLAAIANQVGQLPEHSSVAVSLTITP